MRFYLDEDVDVACRTILTKAGHEAWTTAEAGRLGAQDPEQIVYSDDKGAVFVTHDRKLGQSKLRAAIGKTLWLDCDEPDAAEVLKRHLGRALAELDSADDVTLIVRPNGYTVSYEWDP